MAKTTKRPQIDPGPKNIKLDQNYAEDKEFAATVGNNLIELWNVCRTTRKERERVWQESYRVWTVDKLHTDNGYQGMADLKIPQLRKEIETMSRRIYKGLLPDDYLKAEPDGGLGDDELTMVNTQVVRHYLDNVMQAKRALYPWVKQLVVYGTSPIRQYWFRQENDMFYKKREPFVDARGVIRYKSTPVKEMVKTYDAPKLRAEDMFNTWVYPHSASSSDQIEIVFFRTLTKKSQLVAKQKQKMCVDVSQIQEAGSDIKQEFSESQERGQQFGDSQEVRSLQGDSYYELLEIWCDLILPGETVAVPCVVEIIGQKLCTRIQRNPYWHQKIPIDFGRLIIPPPGEFYGRGLPEACMSLQHQLEDTMNQTMDATSLAISPITIINPAYAPNSESFEIEPGAQWWADPNAIKQFQFPDLTEAGYKAAGTIKGWISELSDNQPQLPDPIAGKARSTGQAQMAINEWQTDLFTFIDFLSIEALNPMAYKIHSLIQQYISDDDVIRVAGRYAGTWLERVITPQDIVGRYKFKWTGALQIENQSIKTQQMLNFIKIYPTLPPEAQQAVKLNWENVMIKLFRDGFLVKDVENIISTERMSASITPDLEERILKLGGEIKVVLEDDDDLHIKFHKMEAQGDKDPLSSAKRAKHIYDHEMQKQKKQAMAQQQAIAQQMQMAQAQGGGKPGGPPKPPGDSSQIPQSTDQASMEKGMR